MRNDLSTSSKSHLEILERGFVRKLDSLVKTKDKLIDDTAELTRRMIGFASSLSDLEEEAKRLDKAYKTRIHVDELEKHLLVKALGLSAALRSRWHTIASQAPALLKLHASLPATRDALYETARALKQDEDVSSWVKKRQITPLSTVQDINNLRLKGKRNATMKKAVLKPKVVVIDKKWIASNKRIPLGISIKDLPTDAPELAFHNDLMLLVVKREVDPDTSKSTLLAISVLNDRSILERICNNGAAL
jgi:hypothetical protein